MTTLTNEQLPERTMLDDIKQIEYDRAIKVHKAYHVHNYYHIWAKRRGFDIVLFLDDEIPFSNCFWGECDPMEAQFTLIRQRIEEGVNSIRLADMRLLIVETTTGIRYFVSKALPAVLEYTITETYLAQ